MNKKYYDIIGFSGVVCLLSGVGYFLVKREVSFYVIVNAVLGAVFLSYYIYANIKNVSSSFITARRRGSQNIILNSVLVLGIVIALNLLSSLFYYGRDFTRDKESSISDKSQKVIGHLKENVEILVFSPDDQTGAVKYLLDSYVFYNKRISYSFIDPEKSPQLAQSYGVTKTGQGVIKYNSSHLLVDAVNEESVTNSIIRMTQSVKNYVYFIMGHGEHVVDDFNSNQGYGLLWKDLLGENYFVHKLKFEPPNYYIPGNCTILVAAGPRRMFTEMEVKAVKEYLENGGRVLLLLDPNVRTGLEGLINEYNIKPEDDCMLDVVFPSLIERAMAMSQGRRASPRPLFQVLVNDFPEHEITRDLKEKSVLMSVAKSISVADEKKISLDLKVEILARTTDKGWGETNLEGLFNGGKISGDVSSRRGPRGVALLSTKGKTEADSKLIVIGDSDFVNNEFIGQLYNRDFFMNCMAYLSKQAALISVRPRHMFASRLDYDPVTMSRIFTVSVLVFPQLFLIAGIAIWRLRR